MCSGFRTFELTVTSFHRYKFAPLSFIVKNY